MPDAKTIWLYREQLKRAGATEMLFRRFDAVLTAKGYLAMGGQIIDATVVAAPKQKLTAGEKAVIKAGGTPSPTASSRSASMSPKMRARPGARSREFVLDLIARRFSEATDRGRRCRYASRPNQNSPIARRRRERRFLGHTFLNDAHGGQVFGGR